MRLGRPGREIVRFLIALSLIYAPLLCLRFCQAVHAVRFHGNVSEIDSAARLALSHTGHFASPAPAAQDEHHPPLNEITQMLTAMTDVLPLFVVFIALMHMGGAIVMQMALRSKIPADIPTPPPKLASQ